MNRPTSWCLLKSVKFEICAASRHSKVCGPYNKLRPVEVIIREFRVSRRSEQKLAFDLGAHEKEMPRFRCYKMDIINKFAIFEIECLRQRPRVVIADPSRWITIDADARESPSTA